MLIIWSSNGSATVFFSKYRTNNEHSLFNSSRRQVCEILDVTDKCSPDDDIGAKSVIHGLKSAKVLTGDTSTSTSLNLAQSWIKDCEMTHGQCGSGRDVSLPKRCLDLKPTSIPDGSAIQLVETHGSTGTYACLSHCWGKDKLITTTSQTIASHLSGIPLAVLPKTFGDAVTLTRNLGLRYLWIDSLCIIQDSREDWQIESSKMADIYHNSFLTIAAISSPDSRGGCFCPEKLSDACFRIQADGLDTLIAARYCNGEGAVTDIQNVHGSLPRPDPGLDLSRTHAVSANPLLHISRVPI